MYPISIQNAIDRKNYFVCISNIGKYLKGNFAEIQWFVTKFLIYKYHKKNLLNLEF